MQPYHTELGAGTVNPATFLRCLGPKPWKAAYVEPVIRPTDGRYGENPFRFQHYFQYQVILKPAPEDVLDLYSARCAAIGIDLARHDLRLVEDDWEQPTLGAWGLGWEVWFDGMEVTQFTYFQQLGGLELDLVPAEITYGLERLAMFLQGKRLARSTSSGRRASPGATSTARTSASGRPTTSRRRPSTCSRGASASTRPSAAHLRRAAAAAARLRPGAEVLAHVQPARRARARSRSPSAPRTSAACGRSRATVAQSTSSWRRDADAAA